MSLTFPKVTKIRVRQAKRFGLSLLLVFWFLLWNVFPTIGSEPKTGNRLARRMQDFSDPAKKAESGKLLEQIFADLDSLMSQGKNSTARNYVSQLELARIGRTPSLAQSPEKQERDRQIILIRKFTVKFLRSLSELETSRDNTETAKKILQEAEELGRKVEIALKRMGNPPVESLEIFEDEFAPSTATNSGSRTAFVNVPTAFFLALHSPLAIPVPAEVPFSILPTTGSPAQVALNNNWNWFLCSWRGISTTVVTGVSPVGASVCWVTGPLSGNRALSCEQKNGRWIISAGDPIPETSDPNSLGLFPKDLLPEPKEAELKCRGFAGFSYEFLPASASTTMSDASVPPRGTLVVRKVFPGTPAARAGLEPGDILVEYGGVPVPDESTLVEVIRNRFAGDEVPVFLKRNGNTRIRTISLEEPSRESPPDLETEYTFFRVGSIRLRAVIVSPRSMTGKPLPALLMVSALGCTRLRDIPGFNARRELAYEVARRGFRVMRFELRGMGDSEGEDYRLTDFNAETQDNLAAFDALRGRADVDPGQVFVFGHSTGGIIAALLAGKRSLAGLIVSGTVGRSYVERVFETVRLQNELADCSSQQIDRDMKEYLFLLSGILRHDKLSDVLGECPALARFVNAAGRIMDDRTIAYWRQKLELNLGEIYAKVKSPVLVVYNSADFIATQACHEWIRTTLLNAGNQNVTFKIMAQADHRFAHAKDFRESFQTYKNTAFTPNLTPLREIADWLAGTKGQTSAKKP